MMKLKSFKGQSLMEYALPFGMIVIVLAVATIAFNDILVSLFTGTINSDNTGGPVKAKKFATLSNPFAILKNFDKVELDALMAKMTVQCVSGANACVPVYGLETSGGMGQEEVDRMTQYILSALRAASTDITISDPLRAKFRALADLGLELSNAQLNLANAIGDGDLLTATLYINAINGGSKTYIRSDCLVGATCIVDSDNPAVIYNIIPASSSGSLTEQISNLENIIKVDPEFTAIPGAKTAMTAVFDALNQRTESISILMSGAPPLTATYTTPEITTFVTEVTSIPVYLTSLISTMGMETSSDATAVSYASDVGSDGSFSSDATTDIEASINQLVDELAATMLADAGYQTKLSGGTYDLKAIADSAQLALDADPTNVILITDRDATAADLATFTSMMESAFAAELSGMSGNTFTVASKLQTELLSDSSLGQDLIDAAIAKALADNSYNELITAVEAGTVSGSVELVDAVMGVLTDNPTVATDLKTLIDLGTITALDTATASDFIIKEITTIENTNDAVEALEAMAGTTKDGSKMSCDTGDGEFEAKKCKKK